MMYENMRQILETAQSEGLIEEFSFCEDDDANEFRFYILEFEKFRSFLQEIVDESDCSEEREFVKQVLKSLILPVSSIRESDVERLKSQLAVCKTVEDVIEMM